MKSSVWAVRKTAHGLTLDITQGRITQLVPLLDAGGPCIDGTRRYIGEYRTLPNQRTPYLVIVTHEVEDDLVHVTAEGRRWKFWLRGPAGYICVGTY